MHLHKHFQFDIYSIVHQESLVLNAFVYLTNKIIERLYLNSDTNMPNDAYKGTWKDYLTPQSINAFVKGEDYKQPNQKALNGMNWTDDDLKKFEKIGKQAGYGKGEIKKQELYKLAKKEGKNLSQVKLELIKAGVL